MGHRGLCVVTMAHPQSWNGKQRSSLHSSTVGPNDLGQSRRVGSDQNDADKVDEISLTHICCHTLYRSVLVYKYVLCVKAESGRSSPVQESRGGRLCPQTEQRSQGVIKSLNIDLTKSKSLQSTIGVTEQSMFIRLKRVFTVSLSDQRLKGDFRTTTSGQKADCLQGQDRSAVIHLNSSHARRCLIRFSRDNRLSTSAEGLTWTGSGVPLRAGRQWQVSGLGIKSEKVLTTFLGSLGHLDGRSLRRTAQWELLNVACRKAVPLIQHHQYGSATVLRVRRTLCRLMCE
ncbi:hypothetical protein J6590_029462 [Homalodisca vitripennis]|nr:hypothetical protein J6590_029462 [Homalodisca vitripennis]